MIIEFKFKNFKSFRAEQIFSLKALSGKNKSDNTFEVVLANGKKIKLLNSAVVYGANASGKTNFILAFRVFHELLLNSNQYQNGASIDHFFPFLFDSSSTEGKCSFEIQWISKEKIIHEYSFSFDDKRFYEEKLIIFSIGRPATLFERQSVPNSNLDKVNLGKSLENKRIEKQVLINQLYLSKIGGIDGHEQLGKVYREFRSIGIWNGLDYVQSKRLRSNIIKSFKLPKNKQLLKKLEKLLNISDTGIVGLNIKSADKNELLFPEFATEEEIEMITHQFSDRPFTMHPIMEEKEKLKEIPLEMNSSGTQTLFVLGGLILLVLKKGGIVFYDEFDNSLHPKLCRFLIRLFNNPLTNPHNAQLVFATHEVSLLDKAIFRKDQIWFTEKDKYGQSTLFSAQDFEGIRDDTPFDKWYMAGKFGGYPKIKELNFIFDDE